jgi:hypothetical protein
MYRSTFSWPRHLLEVSGQIHAPAALPLGKEPPVPIGEEGGWATEPVWTTWRRQNCWSYRDSNSDPSVGQSIASSYTDYAIQYQRNLQYCLHNYWIFGRILKSTTFRKLDLFPSSYEGKTLSWVRQKELTHLSHWTSDSECYTPSSEPFRIDNIVALHAEDFHLRYYYYHRKLVVTVTRLVELREQYCVRRDRMRDE